MHTDVDRLTSHAGDGTAWVVQGAIDEVSSAVPWRATASRAAEQTANRLLIYPGTGGFRITIYKL